MFSPVKRVITKVHSTVVYSASLRGGWFSEGASRGHRGWCLPALKPENPADFSLVRGPGPVAPTPAPETRDPEGRFPPVGRRQEVRASAGGSTRGCRHGARDGRGRPLPNPRGRASCAARARPAPHPVAGTANTAEDGLAGPLPGTVASRPEPRRQGRHRGKSAARLGWKRPPRRTFPPTSTHVARDSNQGPQTWSPPPHLNMGTAETT